ncbi:hypothetical protein RM530_18245 [Algiphilus sp. W345]|uniref:Uncharacterized protein n=1 Tax=Banduia mediterranea TaxID=3075609 RepID=A0ABU2WN76_9GAMM|nr:hypothetical protein [Algiphilus sp. W345]MDT0499286.1 hypothetical protein [Algiphilus sp. W345]
MAVSIVNNAGSDLAIRLADGDEPWARGSAWSSESKTGRLRWVEDESVDGTVPVLDVVRGATVTSYRLRVFPLPAEYLSNDGKPKARLVLENDDLLYAMKPGQQRPGQPQPPRFPLRPDAASP